MDLVRHQGRKYENVSVHEFLKALNNNNSINRRGDYLQSIKNWYAIFPREQIHIEFYENIKEKPKELLNRVFSFLNLPFLTNFQSGKK